MARAEVVGHPVALRPEEPLPRLEAGTEVRYAGLGSVTVARSNADGTYDLQIPGVGTKTVQPTEFERFYVCVELLVAHVRYTILTAHNSAEQEFKSLIKDMIIAEAGVLTDSDITVELYRTSVATKVGERTCWWQRRLYRSSTLARAIAAPRGASAAQLQVRLNGSSMALGQKVTKSFASREFWRPLLPNDDVVATVNTVAVVTETQPMRPPKLYPTQPEMCCWYYNEDDPRSVVIGRDDIQCGQPALAPNIATSLGTCVFIIMVPFLIIFFPLLPCRAAM